jgi:hypothetical protein
MKMRFVSGQVLLALSRPLRRTIRGIAGPTGLFLGALFDLVIGLAPAAMRCLLLMRGMLVILGLEMFGLVLGIFAISGHEFLQYLEPD